MLNLVKTTVFCRYAYNMCKPKKTPQAFLQKHYLLKLQLKNRAELSCLKKFIRNFAFGGYGYESNCLNLTF